jgi:hypothetical protein
METLQAIIAAVAPLMISNANACKGREDLVIRRVALHSIHNVLVRVKLIDYEKGKFSVGRFTVYCLLSATSQGFRVKGC